MFMAIFSVRHYKMNFVFYRDKLKSLFVFCGQTSCKTIAVTLLWHFILVLL